MLGCEHMATALSHDLDNPWSFFGRRYNPPWRKEVELDGVIILVVECCIRGREDHRQRDVYIVLSRLNFSFVNLHFSCLSANNFCLIVS